MSAWEVELRLGKRGLAERLRPAAGYDAKQARRRREREGEILMSLDHPNIVRVRDVCLDEDPPFIVMDLIPARARGVSAAGRRRRPRSRGSPSRCSRRWPAGTRAGWRTAPANVIVSSQGRVVVVDFSLALDPSLERLRAYLAR